MSWINRISNAVKEGAGEHAGVIIQEAITANSKRIQSLIDDCDPADYVLLVLSLKMAGAQLEARLSPSARRLLHNLEAKTVGITEVQPWPGKKEE